MKNDEQYINEIFQKYNKIHNSKEKKVFNNNFISSPLKKLCRAISIIISSIALTGYAVFATNFVVDKIFTKPQVMTYQESIKVDEEEKKKLITEEQAIEYAKDELKNKFNKIAGNITKIELQKDVISYEPRWIIFYDNKIDVQLDALTGKIKSLTDFSIDDTKIPSELSKEASKNIAIELYKALGYKENDYELARFKTNNISEDANLYTVEFSKKYNELYNPYQTIKITFIPEEKQIVTFNWFDYPFDNNEIILTKEQALEIAKNKANELDDGKFKVSSISTKLEIVKMNAYVYSQENPINNIESETTISDDTKIVKIKDENDFEEYVVEAKTRFAWNVEIRYESEFALINEYYVDATTGEIIGGNGTR